MTALQGTRAPGLLKADIEIYTEGMMIGLVGALTIALWFLIVDSFQGRPLLTPSLLGTVLFKGGDGLTSLSTHPISFETVAMFTWIHGMVFVVIGMATSWLLNLAERDPNYGFGVLLLFVLFEFGFICVSPIFAEEVLEALAIPDILIGNLLAAAAMGAYCWRRHSILKVYP